MKISSLTFCTSPLIAYATPTTKSMTRFASFGSIRLKLMSTASPFKSASAMRSASEYTLGSIT